MAYDPAPATGLDMFHVMYGSTFKFDKSVIPSEVDALTKQLEDEYAQGKHLDKRPRILVTGCLSAARRRKSSRPSRITEALSLLLRTA